MSDRGETKEMLGEIPATMKESPMEDNESIHSDDSNSQNETLKVRILRLLDFSDRKMP